MLPPSCCYAPLCPNHHMHAVCHVSFPPLIQLNTVSHSLPPCESFALPTCYRTLRVWIACSTSRCSRPLMVSNQDIKFFLKKKKKKDIRSGHAWGAQANSQPWLSFCGQS